MLWKIINTALSTLIISKILLSFKSVAIILALTAMHVNQMCTKQLDVL